MDLGLGWVVVAALVWATTAMAARPRGERSETRGAERRLVHLRERPEGATRLDLEAMLRSHPLPDATVVRALGLVGERRIGWSVAWRWAERFGSDKLVLALDADVAECRLVRHLDAETTPDWEAMRLFAGLNRGPTMPLAEVVEPDAAPEPAGSAIDPTDWEVLPAAGTVVPEVDLSQFGHLPPIYDPGLPITRSATPPPGARPPLADELDPPKPKPKRIGGGDWPRVA